MTDPLDTLRDLSRDDYYQSMYSCCKELGFKIFKNDYDFTKIQLWFLSFLSMYATISMDIALGDVSDKVRDNIIFEDAYMVYKNKSGNKNKYKKESIKAPEKTTAEKTSWVFKSKVN